MTTAKTRGEAVLGYRPPKNWSLGQVIDELARRYEQRKEADARVAELKAQEDAVRAYLLGLAAEQDLNGAKGASGASIAVVRTTVPTLVDWSKFLAYAKRKGNDDLLQASVSSPAWRERLAAGKAVPGVEPFERVTLRLNPAKTAR